MLIFWELALKRQSFSLFSAVMLLLALPCSGQNGSLTAQVAVDASQIKRIIPRTLYGTNLQYIEEGTGLWNTTANSFDLGVLSYSIALGPSLYRFPGGIYSDSYHWFNGVGPQAARPLSPIWDGGPLGNNDVGTDEALQYASATGGQVMITVNAGSGAADEAANWVKYVNNSGERVKYWEVGNELYYNPAFAPIPFYTFPPSTYASKFIDLSTAMKQADPNIKVIGIGGNFLNQSYPGWDQTLLAQAAPYLDYLSVHNSYAPVNGFSSDDVRTVYSALFAAPLNIAQNLQSLSDEIDSYAGSRASQIGLAVTEWGPLFNLFDSPYALHVRTLGSAIFVASTLKAYVESPRMQVANMFSLLDNNVSAWLGKKNGNYYPEAPYYAMQLYTQHFGSLLVPSFVSAPTYNSPAIGIVPAESNVPYLEVVSSLSADGQKLYIMGINKHFDLPITATIQLKGFNPAPDGSVWALLGTGIDANTGNDFPPGNWSPQMQDSQNPRFYKGSPSEVQLIHAPQTSFGSTFTYTFQPHSVMSIELVNINPLSASCGVSLSSSALNLGAAGGTSNVSISDPNRCAWGATSNVDWISVTSGLAGSDSGTTSLSVGVNSSTGARTGTVTIAGQTFTVTQAGMGTSIPSVALHFVPVTPCRVADTRNSNGPFGGPLVGGQTTRDFTIPNSACGIPATAAAYSLNVTVVPNKPLQWLTIWPTGQPQPMASTLNSFDGRIKANAVIVPAGVNGGVSAFATDDTHVIFDVNGYFVSDSTPSALAFYPLVPCRVADTRSGAGSLAGPSLSAGQARDFPVLTSACQVPASAQAYSVNFTAIPKGPLSYMTVWPTGQGMPLVSTLNAPTGAVTANAAILPTGTNGGVSVYATNETDLVIDINGYFAPPSTNALSFYPLSPCRGFDTRTQPSAQQPFTGTLGLTMNGSCGIPGTAQALVVNATVIPSSTLGWLTLWPSGSPQPNASTLNAYDGTVTSNMAIVPTTGNAANAFASNSTHLILDLAGYFAP